jgi:FkbM family methyltransferase
MRPDVQQLYKPGTDIIDVGGNIGYNSLMFSDYGPVHTFEPLYHSVITKNVTQNTLQNPVKVYPVALSNVVSSVPMYLPKSQDYGFTNYGGSSMTLSDFHREETSTMVQTVRLDDVYTGVPSLMKVDVEGHEFEALLGAENTIKMHKPALYVEIFGYEKSPIVPWLENMGYRAMPRPEHNYLFVL